MRSPACSLAAAALAVAVLCPAAPARADEPVRSPEELLSAGNAELKAGHYDKACKLLEDSYRGGQSLEALFQLGVCEEGRGNVATAAAHYDDYFVLFDRLSATDKNRELKRAEQVSDRRRKLDPLIPTVRLVLPANAPEGTKVTRTPRDGGEPVEMAVGVSLPIDPGLHVISTQAPGGARWQGRFEVKKGERDKALPLQVLAGSEAGRPARFGAPISPVTTGLPPLDPGPTAWRVAAYTTGAIGVAGLLLGAIAGSITWGQKGSVDANCTPPPTDSMPAPRLCNDKGAAAADTAHTWGLVSTVSFVAGGVLAATGITLFFTEPAPPKLQGSLPTVRIGGLATGGATVEVGWTW